jgi:prepilin-type N-terminal cleavage/methylation domain-containing protein
MKNNKGFTLIELLVVIAIIGLLSTLAVVSLNTARAKARDAKRLSDVRQMASILSMDATENESYTLAGCATAGSLVSSCTGLSDGTNTYTTGNEVSKQFSKFKDPTGTTACAIGATGPCDYSIYAAGSEVGSTTIMFYLEEGAGGLPDGLRMINTEGRMQ